MEYMAGKKFALKTSWQMLMGRRVHGWEITMRKVIRFQTLGRGVHGWKKA